MITRSKDQKDLAGFELVMPKRLHVLVMNQARESGMTRAEFVRRALGKAVGNEQAARMPRSIGQKVKRNGRTIRRDAN